MALDSDVQNADSQLHVEFYEFKEEGPYKGQPFVRIAVPGDKTNIIETPVREHHKERFPRQWLYHQMKNSKRPEGISLEDWRKAKPADISEVQLLELEILKFRTVEQVATASDAQLQRVGMGAVGMRERARAHLAEKNHTKADEKLEKANEEIEELKKQVNLLLRTRIPKKAKDTDVEHDAATGDAGNE